MSKAIPLTITEEEYAELEEVLDAYLAEAKKDKGEHERSMARVDENFSKSQKHMTLIRANLDKPFGGGLSGSPAIDSIPPVQQPGGSTMNDSITLTISSAERAELEALLEQWSREFQRSEEVYEQTQARFELNLQEARRYQELTHANLEKLCGNR